MSGALLAKEGVHFFFSWYLRNKASDTAEQAGYINQNSSSDLNVLNH